MLQFKDIKFDCELYNGYKPCRYGNECAGCPYYAPRETGHDAHSVADPAPLTTHSDVEPTRILIVKTGAMGDVLRTTTLLHGLRRRYRDAHITWITDVSAVPLLAANPFIDRLLPFNHASCTALENRVFDLLLNFEKEKEPLAFAGRVRAAKRMGFAPTPWNTATVFNPASEYALLLGLSDELKFHVNQKSYPEIICEMAELQYRRDPYLLQLTAPGFSRRVELDTLLATSTKPRIGLNTGCGAIFRTKQWTLDGWVGLARYLQTHCECEILLLGGKAETDLNREIMAQTSGVIDTGCDNPLDAFFGVVDACDLIVTSDSLGMHIAVALRKYVVALFGSTSHAEVDLYDRGEKIVASMECAPCYRKLCNQDPQWHEGDADAPRTMCMQALASATVGDAVLRGLAALMGKPSDGAQRG